MNRNTLILLGVFVLGCAAGLKMDSRALAQSFPAPASPRKWQQFCEEYSTMKDLNADARQRGDEGWELATVVVPGRIYACFKRPGA